ncbi:diversity-generating retroelement protein Avd [Prochlorothrix hollandica]|uniref:diversity-generating retroelement protein Avd n=1 Tax=Prochlorothrix hollandica TaxID=1223 RepID=UPI00334096B6
MKKQELPIIQKTYDLIKWYVPILNRLPRHHRFQLGDRMVSELYGLLESLIAVRYQQQKVPQLKALNVRLDLLRYQTRLLLDFELVSIDRYRYASEQINGVGIDLGGG